MKLCIFCGLFPIPRYCTSVDSRPHGVRPATAKAVPSASHIPRQSARLPHLWHIGRTGKINSGF